MEDRISSAKKKRINGKRSFSKGKHLTYVPVSELLSTYFSCCVGSNVKEAMSYGYPLSAKKKKEVARSLYDII